MTHHVFDSKLLPKGFKFPKSFSQLMRDPTATRIGPWWFLHRYPESANFWLEELREEYPSRSLVPFAKFSVFDDIACFNGADTSGDPKIYYAFEGASPGGTLRTKVPTRISNGGSHKRNETRNNGRLRAEANSSN